MSPFQAIGYETNTRLTYSNGLEKAKIYLQGYLETWPGQDYVQSEKPEKALHGGQDQKPVDSALKLMLFH